MDKKQLQFSALGEWEKGKQCPHKSWTFQITLSTTGFKKQTTNNKESQQVYDANKFK